MKQGYQAKKRKDREEKALHCDLFNFLSSQGNSLKEDLKKYESSTQDGKATVRFSIYNNLRKLN